MSIFSTLASAWKIPDVRKKIIFTMLMMVILTFWSLGEVFWLVFWMSNVYAPDFHIGASSPKLII